MNEENKNPNNINIVQGNGIDISEVKDNLSFEDHKEKPNKNNIVIPVVSGQPDNQIPEQNQVQEPIEEPVVEDNNTQNNDSDDYIVSDANSSGAQGQAQNTDSADDDFENILNNLKED